MIMNSTTVYIIFIHSVFVIMVITTFDFASHAQEWDWFNNHLNAGCIATSPNQYGLPGMMICPKGMLFNITPPPR